MTVSLLRNTNYAHDAQKSWNSKISREEMEHMFVWKVQQKGARLIVYVLPEKPNSGSQAQNVS